MSTTPFDHPCLRPLPLTNPAKSLLHRETAAKTSARAKLRAPKLQNDILANCFDRTSAIVIAFDAAVKQSLRQLFGSNHVRDLNALTRELPGRGWWRKVQKQTRQQTANVNKY